MIPLPAIPPIIPLMRAADFPYQHTIDVIFRDLDGMRHVNNSVYLTYLESSRIRFLHDVFGIERVEDVPLILGDAYLRYQSPATYPERLVVGLGVSRFGTKSFDMVYQIDAADERVVLTGKTTLVMFDYERGESVGISADFKQTIRDFQQGWEFEE